MTKRIVTSVAFLGILYLLGAFVSGSFNTAGWNQEAKFYLAGLIGVGLLAIWVNDDLKGGGKYPVCCKKH